MSKIGDNCKLVEVINGSKTKYFQSMVSHVIVISRQYGEILLQLCSMFASLLGFFFFHFYFGEDNLGKHFHFILPTLIVQQCFPKL